MHVATGHHTPLPRRVNRLVPALLALALTLAPALTPPTPAHASSPPSPPSPTAPTAPTPTGQTNLRHTVVVEVARKAKDAVVYISAEKLVAQMVSPFGNDPVFGQFGQRPQQVPSNSLGSGFIVHESGLIVTNNHVIDRARSITVTLADGRKFPADVVSNDVEMDLAILRVDAAAELPVLPLGDSSDLMIGEPVIAVGNPLGYSHSVSTGIVSAIHRDIRPNAERALSDLIQTDAAINPGNSGGPLLNAYGQVIGINTAIRSDAQNIGFAIQVNRLRDLIPDLLDPAKVLRVDTSIILREKRTITPPASVTVELELVLNDTTERLRSINGKQPRDIVDAYAILLASNLRHEVKLTTDSGEKSLKLNPVPVPDAVAQARKRLGVTVEPLNQDLAGKLGIPVAEGMLVTEVVRRSIADKAQLQPGDIILQLGRFPVRTLDDFGKLINMLPPQGNIRIGILRGNMIGYGVLQM
jgi:serine protease Do